MERYNYEMLFNCICDGILAIDKEFEIVFFNEAASNITGWSPDEVIGKKCNEILGNSHCSKDCVVKKTFEEACNCYFNQVLIKTKTDKVVPIKISIMPLKGENNIVVGAVMIFSDQRELYPTNYDRFHQLGLVGSSPSMREVFQLIETVAETDATVMVLGKTGTGKEVVANAIHELSLRNNKPFIKVNCAALSDTLLESELFGHEKGAFTGAINKRIGRFEMANSGTIFLDEISEISPTFQAKLLRVIQEGEFERVGSSKTIHVDVRIIAATNKDLEEMVKKNLFRDDLFYRLNVFPITLPELKERRGDLLVLIEYFINRFNTFFKKQKQGVSDDAMEALNKYEFPGNIRELHNAMEHAFIKSTSNIITKEDLPAYLLHNTKDISVLTEVRQEKELNYISQVIEQCNGNKSKAAKILGISRKTLYNKLSGIVSK